MPELPEVETIGRQLRRLVVGKTISSIEVLNKGSFRADSDSLIGKTVTDIGRKGKVLIITSSRSAGRRSGDLARLPRCPDLGVGTPRNDGYDTDSTPFFVHLKMSGQLEFKDEGRRMKDEGHKKKHLRVIIIFDDKSRLQFHDQRKFGWISDDPAVLPPGIDALDPALSSNLPRQRRGKLAEILASSNRPVKTILLDQSKIAGIGNIYASEILWQAGISPFRKGVSLPRQGDSLSEISEKFRKLLTAIRKVLTEAIASGGSTMDDGLYQQVGGESGNYWSRRRVYDREGQPCRRPACRRKDVVIQKIVIGQRSTYFCPNCQK